MKNEFDYSALGARIRKARKARCLTQEQLAEMTNLSTAHIGHIERGTRALSIESLITISNILNVSTDYLLMDISNNDNKKLTSLFDAISTVSKEKYEILYTVIKILLENIDEL